MKTVLITGASRGIGRATAKLFAESGWNLLLIARDKIALNELSDELKSNNKISVYYQSIDLSKPLKISSGIEELLSKGLRPSVLINNAGVGWTGDLLNMDIESWEWVIQMNLTSVFQVCKCVVPFMRSKGGLVINVSSHAARNAFPQWGAYCISKAALASFTRCLAEEERANSIRACTLTIGSVDTTLWDSESVKGDFDRKLMLSKEQVAKSLLTLAKQPSNQVVEDMTLMPATGAF